VGMRVVTYVRARERTPRSSCVCVWRAYARWHARLEVGCVQPAKSSACCAFARIERDDFGLYLGSENRETPSGHRLRAKRSFWLQPPEGVSAKRGAQGEPFQLCVCVCVLCVRLVANETTARGTKKLRTA